MKLTLTFDIESRTLVCSPGRWYCCWCNRTDSCACVKAGKPCQSCLPSHCLNASNDTGPSPPDQPSGTPIITPSLSDPPNGSHDGTPPIRTPTSTPLSPPRTHITHSTTMPRPVRDLDLPSFTPAANPVFTWEVTIPIVQRITRGNILGDQTLET